jgi:peptidoglycan hydrolase CwlO-like protein
MLVSLNMLTFLCVRAQIVNMQEQNGKLLAHCGRLERQKAAVMGQVRQMHDKYSQAASESARMQREIATLRQTLDVRIFSPHQG